MSFTWLTNDLLKDDPPSKSQLSIIACSVQSTKTLENPRNLGIVRACADKSLLCFFLDRPELCAAPVDYIGGCELLVTNSQWVPPDYNNIKKHQIQDLTFD